MLIKLLLSVNPLLSSHHLNRPLLIHHQSDPDQILVVRSFHFLLDSDGNPLS
jgi:hypothetical protein